jgi:NTE family protein
MQSIALLLQGGGALGAYELGVLRHMNEQHMLPLRLVAGVSIGAVNAAVLVGSRSADPLTALETLWKKLTVPTLPFAPQVVEQNLALFGNPHMSKMRLDYWNLSQWQAIYSPEPLKALLHELIDFDKLNASPTTLQLSTIQLESGEIEIFSNRNGQTIGVDEVIASLSIPPMFPPVDIRGKHYWDGGLFDNAPLGAMIDALPDDDHTRFIIVNLFPLRGTVPQNLTQVQDRMLDIIFSNKVLGDVDRMADYTALAELGEALDKSLPANSAIRKLSGFKDIVKLRMFERPLIIPDEQAKQEPPEDMGATLDFSAQTIARRIDAGYRDAKRVLAD